MGQKPLHGVKMERHITEYLEFLRTLSKTSEDYLYLLDLQQNKAWIFGNIEEHFDLGEVQEDGSYCADQWVNSVHLKDRPYLVEDVELLTVGQKDHHNMDYRVTSRTGGYIWVNCQGTVQQDKQGKPSFMVGRISETALRYRVDSLTGLFNMEQIKEDFDRIQGEVHTGYLLLMGIDHMKNINALHGRNAGDQALRAMATILQEEASSPKVYRLGGDMFAVAKFDVASDVVKSLFDRVQKRADGQFTISGGAVALEEGDQDLRQLVQYSEFALQKAKAKGRNILNFFKQEEYQAERVSTSLLGELTESVKRGCEGFSLVYQPQMKTGSYGLFGAEALLRYESPTRGRVFPDEFIPLLEQYNLIHAVGLWVLKTALAQCKEWRKLDPTFHISVNMSYAQLSHPDITDQVLTIIEESGLPGSALTIEVTESMQLQEYNHYNEIFFVWKQRGINISVDDFGTGYSSLGYLKNLNIDEIKIDRCFVSGIQASSYNYRLISNMVQLAADSSIRVCCEGVEETDELQVLDQLKPALLQGYLFSRPCDPQTFTQQFLQADSAQYGQYLDRVLSASQNGAATYLNMQHWDILRSISVGLWMLRKADGGKTIEMYTDETMRRLLGIHEPITPAECYRYWLERVKPEYRAYLSASVAHALETGELTRVHYRWNHPERGEVEVWGMGARAEALEGEQRLEGAHCILDDSVKLPPTAFPVGEQ